MKKALIATQEDFESSSQRTPEYLEWHKLFKKEFIAFLKKLNCTKIEIGNPNHFDISGFFTSATNQIWWFRIEDLRWSKDQMLIRTAKDYKDYTGGHNQFVTLNPSGFINQIQSVLS